MKRKNDMKTIKVVAAVIRDGDKIFATQRGYGDLKGGWEFPGGKIEERETPQEALKREIMEELDTEIEVGELIDTIEYDYPEFHLSMGCYWCSVVSGDLVLKEHEAARWLEKDELMAVIPKNHSLIKRKKFPIEALEEEPFKPLEKPVFQKIGVAMKSKKTASAVTKKFLEYLKYRS